MMVKALKASAGVFALTAAAALASPAWAEARIALVVGNADYKQTGWRLASPDDDARAMAATLKELGFELVGRQARLNLDEDAFEDAVADFGRALGRAGPDAVGLFYYSGHGSEDGGKNYLVPVDFQGALRDELKADSIRLGEVLEEMGDAGNALNFVFLDACRNNPLPAAYASAPSGLVAEADTPPDVVIAYAAAPGQAIKSPASGLSPFTSALIQRIQEPQPAMLALPLVQGDVVSATGGAQRPWLELGGSSTQVDGRFFQFAAGVAPPPPPPPQKDYSAELEAEREKNKALQDQLASLTTPSSPPVASGSSGAVVSPPSGSGEPRHGYSRDGKPIVDGASVTQATPAGTVFKDCADCPEMIVIPSGEFRRGSPDGEAGRGSDEGPVRTVRIATPFAVSRYEVTRGQYAAFDAATNRADGSNCWTDRDENGSWEQDPKGTWRDPGFTTQGDDHPVVCVDWSDAAAFAAWTKDRSGGRGYRLLSEAEFEYANRAGTTAAYATGSDDPATLCRLGNVRDKAFKRKYGGADDSTLANCDDDQTFTAPVGGYAANAFGVFDLSGNVWEWVADCYRNSYETAPTDGSAVRGDSPGADECSLRVLRGGSCHEFPQYLRSAYRDWDDPTLRGNVIGFRLARTVSP